MEYDYGAVVNYDGVVAYFKQVTMYAFSEAISHVNASSLEHVFTRRSAQDGCYAHPSFELDNGYQTAGGSPSLLSAELVFQWIGAMNLEAASNHVFLNDDDEHLHGDYDNYCS
jgi:hypothetical protein